MKTHPMKLVTIIAEALAWEPLRTLLHEVGAHGYTIFKVEGSGSRGERVGDIEEFANIQLEVIVPAAVAVQLLVRLQAEFFPRYALVAYEQEVGVLRRDKF